MESLKRLFGQSKKPAKKQVVTPGYMQGTVQLLQTENIRLKEEVADLQDEVVQMRLKLRALRTLQEASMNITPHTDVMKLLERVLQSALLSIGASDGSLMLVDDASKELVFAVVHGQVKNSLVGHRIPLGTGIAGWVAENREPIVIADVQRDSRFSTTVDQSFRFSTRSMVCVPVLNEDRVMGVFQALNKFEEEPFTDADLATMCLAAQLATTAIVRAEAVAAVQDT